MATDQQKCEALVGELAFIGEQDVYQSTITIYSSGQAILVGRTTDGTAKKVNFEGLPALRAALRSHAQYGFGHPLDRDGIQWEFRQAPTLGSRFSSSSSSGSSIYQYGQ